MLFRLPPYLMDIKLNLFLFVGCNKFEYLNLYIKYPDYCQTKLLTYKFTYPQMYIMRNLYISWFYKVLYLNLVI